MSNMNATAQSFIEMVEAYKAKPELEARIADLNEANVGLINTRDWLNAENNNLADRIADLESRLAKMTEERDNATFRNLELEEAADKVRAVLLGVKVPEPEAPPTPQPEPVVEQPTSEAVSGGEPASVEVKVEADPLFEGPKPEPIFPVETESSLVKSAPSITKPFTEKPWWQGESDWINSGGESSSEYLVRMEAEEAKFIAYGHPL